MQAGVPVTVLAAGRTYLSQEHDIWVSPAFQLWYRIGESGEVFRGTRCSHTFTPDTAGRLFLAGYLPGEWATRTGGSAVPADAYQRVKGETSVLIVRWAGSPLDGLKRLAAEGDVANLLATEIDRLENPVPQPTGWEYLWFLGPSDSYTMSPNPRGSQTMGQTTGQTIGCYTHHDAAILQRDVSCEFTPDTSLRWVWKVDTLPSPQSEDNALTHDYLSIAVEFDNGQDLTYYWSVNLPPETAFRCPLPNWAARETHLVVRSG